jgi:DnaJ-class molecular chaperone
MAQARKDCEICAGAGVVQRERRKLVNGLVDPSDMRPIETCPHCGGGGKVTDWGGKPVPQAWRESGFAADNIKVGG